MQKVPYEAAKPEENKKIKSTFQGKQTHSQAVLHTLSLQKGYQYDYISHTEVHTIFFKKTGRAAWKKESMAKNTRNLLRLLTKMASRKPTAMLALVKEVQTFEYYNFEYYNLFKFCNNTSIIE